MSKNTHQIVIEGVYKDMLTLGMRKSKKEVKDLGDKAKVSKEKLGRMGGAMKKLGTPLQGMSNALRSTTVRLIGFTAATAAVGKGVRVFLDTEKALAEVATISPEVAKNIDGVGASVSDLAMRFGVAESAVSKGLYQTISAGVSDPQEALKTLNVALGLAKAGIADTTDTTDLLVGTMNAFGEAGGDASRVADIMFATVRRGKTTIGELATSMSMVTPQAAALGVSLEEVNAAVATITLSGAPTAIAVTQVGAALSGLLKKSGDINAALEKTGKSFSLERLRNEGLIPILEDLRQAYKGNEEGLTELLGRKEAMLAIFGLTGDKAQVFNSILGDVTDSTGSYEAALGRMAQTADTKVSAALEGMRQGLGTLGESLMEGLLGGDGLTGGLDDANAAAKRLKETFENFAPLLEGIGLAVKGWGDIFGAVQGSMDTSEFNEWFAMIEETQKLFDQTGDPLLLDALAKQYRSIIPVMEDLGMATGHAKNRMMLFEEIVRNNAESMVDHTVRGHMMTQELEKVVEKIWDANTAFFIFTDTATLNAQGLVQTLQQIGDFIPGIAPAPGMPAPLPGPSASGVSPSTVSPAANPVGSETGIYGTGPYTGPIPQAPPGLDVFMKPGGKKPLDEGPKGAEKAWADLEDQIGDTAAQQEAFAKRGIESLGYGLTNAIMDVASGAKSAKDAFKDFAAGFLADIAKMIIQQQVFNAISSFSPFGGDGGAAQGIGGGVPATAGANGGMLADLPAYASGFTPQVVTKPHVALIGEGRHNEAVVPMPGGKEIPVNLNGSSGGAEVNISISAMDGADVERVLSKPSGQRTIRTLVQDAMMNNTSFRNTMKGGRN